MRERDRTLTAESPRNDGLIEWMLLCACACLRVRVRLCGDRSCTMGSEVCACILGGECVCGFVFVFAVPALERHRGRGFLFM